MRKTIFLRNLLFLSVLVFVVLVIRLFPEQKFRSLATTNFKAKYCTGVLTSDDLVSSQERKSYENSKSQVHKIRGGNKLDELFTKKIEDSEYGINVGIFAGPWVLFTIFSLFGYFCYCMCCCCDCCCPPSQCCRRDYKKKALTTCEKFFPLVMILLLGTTVLACSIAGFVMNSNLSNGWKKMQCSVAALIYEFINGVTENGVSWIGITPTVGEIDNIMSNLQQKVNDINGNLSNTNWITPAKNTLVAKIDNLYTLHQNAKVITPNPGSSPSATVNSLFIDTILGPKTTTGTMTYVLNLEVTGKAGLIGDLLVTLKSSCSSVLGQIGTINSALQSGRDSIQSISNTLNDQQNTIDGFLGDGDPIMSLIKLATLILWIVIMVCACMSLLGAILLILFRKKWLRYILHITWILVSLLMFLGFLLCIVLAPVSAIMMDVCGVIDIFIGSQAGMERYTGEIDASVIDKIKICMWDGSGDIAEKFGIKDKLTEINGVTGSFADIEKYTNSSSPDYINLSNLTTMNFWVDLTASYRDGSMLADSSATDDDNSIVALTKMTSYGDHTQSGSLQNSLSCQKTKDQWVFAPANCSTGYDKNYNNMSDPATYNRGNPTCFEIMKASAAMVTARYSGFFACSSGTDIAAELIKYFNSLDRYDQSRRELFKNINLNVTEIKNDNVAFTTNVFNLFTPLLTITSTVNDFISRTNAVINKFNCKFLYTNFLRMRDSICISTVTPLYQLFVILAVASFAMFFNSYFSYRTAMRFSHLSDLKPIHSKVGSTA